MSEHPNVTRAREYLRAIEQGATGDALRAFFTDDAIVRTWPNRLAPNGSENDVAAVLVDAERGQRAIASQRYAVRSIVAEGDLVAIESEWTGVLKVPLGSLPVGGTMRAAIATFLTFRDGRICSQRQYDCFEPF